MYDSYNMTHVTRSFFQENIVMIYQNPLIRDIMCLRGRVQFQNTYSESLDNKLSEYVSQSSYHVQQWAVESNL